MTRSLLLLALLVPGTALADITVNEVMINPAGADTDLHWIELYNDGASAVDLTGWTLERAKSAWDLAVPLTGVVPAGGYLVIGEPNVTADLNLPLLDFGNGATSADAIRLLDASGTIIDTLVYGGPNTDGWDDDVRTATDRIAPAPTPGDTLSRVLDGRDSDDASADFANTAATPGSANPVQLSCAFGPGVVINEILPNPAGLDDDLEWIELYNPTDHPADLSGWAIEAGTSGFFDPSYIPPVVLAAREYLVIGQSALPYVDVVVPGFEMGNASSNADAVRILDCGGGVVDTVVYGGPNTDGWLDDSGAAATGALAPFSGRSLGRARDGIDTDDASADFVIFAGPNPGEDNPMVVWTSDAVPGQTFTVFARGADPGQTVFFGRSSGPGTGPCPALLGGLCLDIGNPFLMGTGVADAGGLASYSVFIPSFVSPGINVYLQAAAGLPHAQVSEVVLVTSGTP